MKIAPDDQIQATISPDSQRVKDWLKDCSRNIKRDMEDRSLWVQAREHYFSRRYCLEWRDPTFPWVGSSNIVLPLIDKKIDELKPQYVNMIAAARPPVTAHAIEPQYQKKAKDVELLFDWLVHHGSPNFINETILAVDDCLETGRGILRSYWNYETRQSPGYLTASRLPERLRRLIVTKRPADEADNLFVAAGGGAIVLTPREFDKRKDAIREMVEFEMDLEDDEPRDRKAIDSIMAWLRSGAKEPLRYESRDIVTNVPAIVAVNPIDFIVPENATADIEQHERITEVMYLTKHQLQARAIDGKFDKGAMAELLDIRKKRAGGKDGATGRSNWHRQLIDQQQADREGITTSEKDDLFEIWRISSWMATDEGGRDKKVVAIVPADAPQIPLKIKTHYRPSGKWGYHSFTFEHNKNRWYSPRGVPEKLDDLEAEITAQHRAKLNRMALANAITVKYKPGQAFNVNNMKFIPGQAIPTKDPVNDFIPMVFQNLDMSFDRETQDLRTWAESYLGGPDYGLAEQNSLSEARTATEIQAIQGQSRQSLAMRGLLMKLAYDEIWREFFDLWHTMGPEEVYVRVTGGGEPIKLTKEELQGNFIFTCTGTIGSTDPVLEAQKAQNRLILLAQFKPLIEPQYELNLGEAIIDWMEKDDVRLMKRVIRERSPEELEQIAQQQAQEQAAQMQEQMALAATGAAQKPQGKPAKSPYPKVPTMGGGAR